MDDISVKRALAAPVLLAILMVGIAAVISQATGVDGSRVFIPYISTWMAVTLMLIPIWIFVQVALLAPTRADRPLQTVIRRLHEPLRLTPLPAIIFPIFLAGYTWAKCSIPFAVGYRWEHFWADADRMFLGRDAWALAHSVMPDSLATTWTFFYSVIWGFALVLSGALIATFASRRFTAIFYTALMLSWLIGGIGMAYLMSAAGPVFAHLSDPDLAARFLPLRAELARILGDNDLVVRSQRYLEEFGNTKIALKGGGISAMPSMHIATATTLIIAARGTKWLPLAILFLGMTFFGSIYLGYHYAMDAPVAALVAICCWLLARRIHMPLNRSARTAIPMPAAPSAT
jgi:hypothetical protein